MIHLCVVLMLALAQDVPTPGGKPGTPPPKGESGTAGGLGLGTGKGSAVGQTKGESAALGLRTKQNVAGTEHGEVHAIAEVAPTSAVEGGRRLVYGFCAITDEWLLESKGQYRRGELYLYRPGTRKDRGTRDDKRPDEEFYHAVVEHGRIVSEAGDRKILKEFADLGADGWSRPFERILGIPIPKSDRTRIVMGVLSRTVQDLVRGEKGNGDPRLKDLTRIERDDTVKGAMGRDWSKN